MTAGYSGTPLSKKLGIKEGARVALVGSPRNFTQTLGELPDNVKSIKTVKSTTQFDVAILFTQSRDELEGRFATLIPGLAIGGGIWVAWPKKTSGVRTDLTENILRDVCLSTGLVDNKVCAIDETWSGLRFVRRKPR